MNLVDVIYLITKECRKLYNMQVVGNEYCFVLVCPVYSVLRLTVFEFVVTIYGKVSKCFIV